MPKVKPFPIIPPLLLLLLASCGSLSPAGLRAASRLDPLTTPAGDVALAISVPETVRLTDGDAVLRITFAEQGRSLVDTQVPLAITRETPDGLDAPEAGQALYVGRVAGAEAQAFSAAQAEIRRLRAAGSAGTGSLQIQVNSGCRLGPPLQSLPVSSWLRPAPGAAFVPLTRRVDILDRLQRDGARIPAC